MIPGITREGMVEVDRIMVHDLGIDVELMMEHAGLNLARLVLEYYTENYQNIVVVAGPGNNGGGGIVCARRLHGWGIPVELLLPRAPSRDIPTRQLKRAKHVGVKTLSTIPTAGECLVVDAYLGYNYKSPLRDPAKPVIEYMNAHDHISLDIPSAIDANTGINDGGLHPLATLTLAWPKVGLLQLKDLGKLYLADIGIPSWIFQEASVFPDNMPSREAIDTLYHEFKEQGYVHIKPLHSGWKIV